MQSRTGMILGIIFLAAIICVSYFGADQARAQVSFTYTAPATERSVEIGDTTKFFSTVTNTGSGSDTYDIYMIEKPPTPTDWWMRFCAGGICGDSTATHMQMSVNASDSDEVELDMLPRSTGTGKVTMKIVSQANPSVQDSITFTLRSASEVPVLNKWGLAIFIILLTGTGFYLIQRRLRLSKAN